MRTLCSFKHFTLRYCGNFTLVIIERYSAFLRCSRCKEVCHPVPLTYCCMYFILGRARGAWPGWSSSGMRCCRVMYLDWKKDRGPTAVANLVHAVHLTNMILQQHFIPEHHIINSSMEFISSPNTTSSTPPWNCSTALFQLGACFTSQPQLSSTCQFGDGLHQAVPLRTAVSGFACTALDTSLHILVTSWSSLCCWMVVRCRVWAVATMHSQTE